MTYPIITFEQLEAEVRRLAEDRPFFSYATQPGREVSDNCSYLGVAQDNPNEGEGCIVGQALGRLGFTREQLSHFESNNADHLVKNLNIATDEQATWIVNVQCNQDAGYTWGAAIEDADDPLPEDDWDDE